MQFRAPHLMARICIRWRRREKEWERRGRETHLPKTFEMLCTCQNAQINNARQLRLHYPRRRSRRARDGEGEIRIWNANKNFKSKGSPAEAAATKGLESSRFESRRSSGTKDDKNDGGMPPKSEARQAQALPSFGALLSSVLYVSPSLDRPAAAAPTVIILMTTVIVLFLSPLCARRCKSTSEFTRSPFLPLFPSLSFVLVCKQMHVLAKTPGQDRSKKRAKGAAVKPPTRQPQHPQESISLNHQRWQNFVFLFSRFFWKLICAACCLL